MGAKQGNCHYEIERNQRANLTSRGGLLPAVELWHRSNLSELANEIIGKRPHRGFEDGIQARALMLLNFSGFDAVDDLDVLRADKGLCDLLDLIDRREGVRRCGCPVPSPSAFRAWLDAVGGDPTCLQGVRAMNTHLLTWLQERCPERIATIDMDATYMPTKKGEAKWSYKGERANQSMNAYWAERDMMLFTEYREGNVNPGAQHLEMLQNALECLPQGVEKVRLRTDTAGYVANLLRYCNEGQSPWGVIDFAISCPVTAALRREVCKLESQAWQPLDESGGQEWAEVNFVPSSLSTSKKSPKYRFLVLRSPAALSDAEKPDVCQLTFEEMAAHIDDLEQAHPRVRKLHLTVLDGKIWKIFAIVTNLHDMPGEDVIRWQRARCGRAEEMHAILKNDLAGGHVPSASFGASAAWWHLTVLALNLQKVLLLHVLPSGWGRVRQKRLLATLYAIPGRISRHARKTILTPAGHFAHIAEEALKALPQFCENTA